MNEAPPLADRDWETASASIGNATTASVGIALDVYTSAAASTGVGAIRARGLNGGNVFVGMDFEGYDRITIANDGGINTNGSIKAAKSITAKFGTGGLDKAFKVQTSIDGSTITTASIDLDGNAVFSQGDPSAGDAASTIKSDGTAVFTGNVTAANITATNLTAMKVPYIDANGVLQSMPDVTFNPTTNSLNVTKIESPSIPQATSFKGAIDATTETAPSAVDDDVYSNTTSGTAGSSFTGIAGLTLAANQLIFYADNQWERGGVEEVSNLVTLS